MSHLNALTSGLSSKPDMAEAAANFYRGDPPLAFEDIVEFFTSRGAQIVKDRRKEGRKVGRKLFAEAAPQILTQLHGLSVFLKGSRGQVTARVGGSRIEITEGDAGLMIADSRSCKSRMFGGKDFESLMYELACEVYRHSDLSGAQTVDLAGSIEASVEPLALRCQACRMK